MPKTVLSVIALLVAVFLVALGGSLTGNAIAGSGQPEVPSTEVPIAGPSGVDGKDGGDGAVGIAGAQGATGPTGPRGTAGVAGKLGETGLRGPAGAAGPQGPAGDPGRDGASGADGADGVDAVAGVRIAYRATQVFDHNAERLLQLSPGLAAGVWVLELDWNELQGTGGCDLTVGATRTPVQAGFKTEQTFSGGEGISVDCAAAAFSQPYEVRSFLFRATMVG